ncbi:MAG: ral secretion pathway protein [Candidatus Sumerlaeota bacterium]|nr:ral secretion pathway protein [Candidatus Sumerlaeota bacterium]
MARFCWKSVLATAAGLVFGATAVWADALVTMSGKRIEGSIVSETADDITIRTQQYGDLKFRKISLKEVVRTSGSASNSSSTNPFSGAENINPFGNSMDSPGSTTTPTTSVAVPTPAPTPEPIGERAKVTPPTVPFSWDAVLFSVPEGQAVGVAAQPDTEMQATAEETPLRAGAEIATGEGQARVVFKSGRDMMRVSPHTALTMVDSTANRVEIDLRRGSIWMELGEGLGANRVIVRTTNAVVLGEEGVFRVADALDRGFHVASVEGTTVVQSTKAQIATRVNEGEMVLVRPDGSITAPQSLSTAVRREDASWDELGADWWFRAERTLMPGLEDPMLNLVSMNEQQAYLRTLAEAFLRFAEDTGHVPTSDEAFSVLRQNTGAWPNWQGPYFNGLLPPLDSWGRPLKYVTRETGHADHVVGIVYSTGEDNVDNDGDPSADVSEMVLYYQLENLNRGSSANQP